MKKLIISIIITLTAFTFFNINVKASNNLYFTKGDGSQISNNTIELTGDESVNISLYVSTLAEVYGAVIP